MTHQLAELKLMLRHNLFLDLDEHALMNTKQEGLVCGFFGMRLASAFQPIFRTNGEVIGREALLRASLFEHGSLTLTPHLILRLRLIGWCSSTVWCAR